MVASQLRIFTPVGTAMNMVANGEALQLTEIGPMPEDEHVVGPHTPAHEADGDTGEDHRTCSRRSACGEKVGMTLGDMMPKARQDDEVHLGVPEDPEEVLPQERVGALVNRIEEAARRTWRSMSSKSNRATVMNRAGRTPDRN